MSAFHFTRRETLVAAIAAVATVAVFTQLAAAHSGRIGGARVDVRPLLENSGEPTAGWVANELPGALAAAIDGSAAAPVSVRIDYVILGPNTGGIGPAGASPDQMIGEVTAGGVTRPLRATTTYYPSAADTAMIEQSNHQRVSALVRAFAGWVAGAY